VASGTPVAAILRPARTPKGSEVCTVIKHVTKRLRRHWSNTRLVWRGDSHYGRVEAMDWAEDHGADYIFGLAGNPTLDALTAETAVNLRFCHAMRREPKLRAYVSFLYQAGSWRRPRKVVARLECSLQPGENGMRQEVDIRYVVTSLKGSARHLYASVYCHPQRLVHLHEVVPSRVQRDHVAVIVDFLAECIREPRKALHAHAHGQIVPLGVAGRDMCRIRIASDPLAPRADAFARAISTPIDENDLFAGRGTEVRKMLEASMERGKHVILFGERGVGKTSLARVFHSLFPSTLRHIFSIREQADPSDDFASVWRKIFKDIHIRAAREGKQRSSH